MNTLFLSKTKPESKADKGRAGYEGVFLEEVLLANNQKLLVNS